jgi:hypothetical protein
MTTSQKISLNSLDAINSKIYFLTKILLKRISKFWHEGCKEIYEMSGEKLLAFLLKSHIFKFLNDCLWVDAPTKPTNVVGTQTVGALK